MRSHVFCEKTGNFFTHRKRINNKKTANTSFAFELLKNLVWGTTVLPLQFGACCCWCLLLQATWLILRERIHLIFNEIGEYPDFSQEMAQWSSRGLILLYFIFFSICSWTVPLLSSKQLKIWWTLWSLQWKHHMWLPLNIRRSMALLQWTPQLYLGRWRPLRRNL